MRRVIPTARMIKAAMKEVSVNQMVNWIDRTEIAPARPS